MSKKSHVKHEHKQAVKHRPSSESVRVPHEDYQAGTWGDVIIFILILGLGLFFVLPFYAYVPTAGGLVIMIVFLLIILAFIAIVWRRKRRKK